MTKLFLMTAAAMFSVAASPVLASDSRPAVAAATTGTPAARDATRAVNPAQKYCVVDTTTGSRVTRKICQTRDAWLNQGFDPLAKQ